MPFKIAIIGAGPSGCTLARIIQHRQTQSNPISVTIFEAESRLDVRSQGGTLDLHEKTGQAALKAAGLFEEFQKHTRYEGEALKIADKNYLCYIKQNGSKGKSTTGRPEIDRPVLRQILYDSLAPGTVQWGKKVTRVIVEQEQEQEQQQQQQQTPSKNEKNQSLPSALPKPKLLFSTGEQSPPFDLIVGSDGAWSKIRPYLSSTQPVYSGISGYSLILPSAAETHPELWADANGGSVFSFSDGKSIMAQVMGDGSINVGTWSVGRKKKNGGDDWRKTGVEAGDNNETDAEAVKKVLREEEYRDWDPRLVAYTQNFDGEKLVARDLYMLPVGHRWEHRVGVTLLGDAAHVMTPFAGEGVNLGMQDALKLAEGILSAATAAAAPADADAAAAGGDDDHAGGDGERRRLDEKVKAFEEDMFVRATKTQQLTVDMMNAMFFTAGAPRNGIERYVLRAVEDEMGPFLTALVLTPLVYSWFFIFKLIW